jgi:glycosyltransferase involved in cell wall biosynthesis
VAWGSVAGRSEEIATALGGEARCFYPLRPEARPPVLVRYLISSVATAAYLLRRRPRVVVVTNPPLVASLVTYVLARLIGAKVILDSHPGGFGVQGDRVAARLQRPHRWLVRQVALVLVTEDTWKSVVESWGGTALVVHEAPNGWNCEPPRRGDRLSVLVVGRLAADEPVAEVIEAAATLPEVDFAITGDRAAFPAALRERIPRNVTLIGFLDPERYRAAVTQADAVLTLTTEPTSVMRAACEAVYARRPVVISDWPIGRELFRHAVHATNSAPSIADAIASLEANYEQIAASVDEARGEQLERWEAQRGALAEAIEETPSRVRKMELQGRVPSARVDIRRMVR